MGNNMNDYFWLQHTFGFRSDRPLAFWIVPVIGFADVGNNSCFPNLQMNEM